jgi:hypothetical protein
MVVNLTIEGDHIPAAGRHHRLMSGGGEIENSQPPMRERKPGMLVRPHPDIIRPAVDEGIGRAAGGILQGAV